MIRLSVTTLIFFHILFTAIIILIVWVISGYGRAKRLLPRDVDLIWKCSVCSNTYIDSRHDDISVCTLCGSYNKREEQEGGS